MIAFKNATFCLKPASVGAGLWSTRPGSQSSSIVARTAARNAGSKRVMISMVPGQGQPSVSVGADGVAYAKAYQTRIRALFHGVGGGRFGTGGRPALGKGRGAVSSAV